jgi:hypothetical protein
MKSLLLKIFIFLFFVDVSSQYISEVIEYYPAPGQLINTPGAGAPACTSSIIGGVNGLVSLGGYGGYIVFRFDSAVKNHPDNPFGVDFTIFGNALPDWSEPGCVYVMKDSNNNNLPDETWYLLAGSDYYFSTSIKDYSVTYKNSINGDSISWFDNRNNKGVIIQNSFYTQSYYPDSTIFSYINKSSYTLSGIQIAPHLDTTSAINKSYKRSFGYCDNNAGKSTPYTIPDNPYTNEKENSGGDGFDISWAIDKNNNHVHFDEIDFIKVQNCVMAFSESLGELSTEITGAVDVPPDNKITGSEKTIVIKRIPEIIDTSHYQIEAFVFNKGKIVNEEIKWETSNNNYVTIENQLVLTENGLLTISASLYSDPSIEAIINTEVSLQSRLDKYQTSTIEIFPIPATEFIRIKGCHNAQIQIIGTSGKVLYSLCRYSGKDKIPISFLQNGIYIIKISEAETTSYSKIVKQ